MRCTALVLADVIKKEQMSADRFVNLFAQKWRMEFTQSIHGSEGILKPSESWISPEFGPSVKTTKCHVISVKMLISVDGDASTFNQSSASCY